MDKCQIDDIRDYVASMKSQLEDTGKYLDDVRREYDNIQEWLLLALSKLETLRIDAPEIYEDDIMAIHALVNKAVILMEDF